MQRTGHRRLKLVAALSTTVLALGLLGAGSAAGQAVRTTARPSVQDGRGAHRVVATIRTSYPIAALALDPGVRTLYATVGDGDQLLVISTRTRRVTRVLDMPCSPSSVAVDPSTHRVFVGCDRTLRVMSRGLRRQLAVRRIGEDAIVGAVDPATHRVYVTSAQPSRLTTVDTRTSRVLSRRRLGDSPWSVALDPGRHTLYVTEGDYGPATTTLEAIDTRTGRLLARTPIGTPYSVVVNQRTHAVYVIGSGRTVAEISPTTHRVIRRITVRAEPIGLAFDTAHQLLYVACDGDNYRVRTLSVIDAPSSRVVAKIGVPRAPSGMAVDPATDLLYIGSLSAGTVTVEHITP